MSERKHKNSELPDKKDVRFVLPLFIVLAVLLETCIDSFFSVDENRLSPCKPLNVRADGRLYQLSAENLDSNVLPPELGIFAFLPVPINSADAEILQTIKGVGPKLAKQIIEYREDRRFTGPDSLLELQGLGKKRADYLATQVRFE